MSYFLTLTQTPSPTERIVDVSLSSCMAWLKKARMRIWIVLCLRSTAYRIFTFNNLAFFENIVSDQYISRIHEINQSW